MFNFFIKFFDLNKFFISKLLIMSMFRCLISEKRFISKKGLVLKYPLESKDRFLSLK